MRGVGMGERAVIREKVGQAGYGMKMTLVSIWEMKMPLYIYYIYVCVYITNLT